MDGDPESLIDAYLGTKVGRAPNTLRTYEGRLRTFVRWCAENEVTVKTCTRAHLSRYFLNREQARPRQAATSRASETPQTIRRFYEWAVAEGHVEENPTLGLVGASGSRPSRQVFIELDDLRALIRASAPSAVDSTVIMLLGVVGLSLRDLVALDVGDVRREAGSAAISVRRSGNAPKVYPVPPLLQAPLFAVMSARSHGPLLSTTHNNRIDRGFVTRIVKRVAAQAGLTNTLAARDLTYSAAHIGISEGFSFLEILDGQAQAHGKFYKLLDSFALHSPPRRPAAFRLAALVRPDQGSNDALLDQAEALAFVDIHPAARVMFAGAVLERHMRSLAEQSSALGRDLRKPESSGITSWTGPLTGAGILDKAESMDCQHIADRRNEAAHGYFEKITVAVADDVSEKVRKLLAAHPLRSDVPEPQYEPKPTRLAQKQKARAAQTAVRNREATPDRIKQFVWQRDRGVCTNCGTNHLLEFDHIIPLAMGGSNTARNLQLLCQTCNRSKGPRLF